jgi:hypothetical protein
MQDGTMWLRDFLPEDIPKARVLAFVYPSKPFGDPDYTDLRELGARLLRSLLEDRAKHAYKAGATPFEHNRCLPFASS